MKSFKQKTLEKIITLSIFIGFFLLCSIMKNFAGEQDFFPLEVGNKWIFEKYDKTDLTYTNPMGTFTIEVVGTISIKDTMYFIITQNWNELIANTLYLRKEAHKFFNRAEDWDMVLYDFDALEETSWEVRISNPQSIDWTFTVFANSLSENEFIEEINLDPNRQYFGFRPYWGGQAWYEVYYADVGPVYIRQTPQLAEIWDIGKLKEAHVGGKIIYVDNGVSVPINTWYDVKKMFR